MNALPDVEVVITEYTELEHNLKNGIERGSSDLVAIPVKKKKNPDNIIQDTAAQADLFLDTNTDNDVVKTSLDKSSTGTVKVTKNRKSLEPKEKESQMYYLVSCKDNGCGILTKNIGEMLGRVLSGSKHGVRQTRGKFGLGAKMVLYLIN